VVAIQALGKKLLWVFTVIGVLSAAGCLETPTQPVAKTFIGVVADGYLQGAIVFLDKNNNKVLDPDEPCAVTDASGTYVVSNVTLADLLTYPVVVRVLATAIDRGTGKAVGKEYILSSPPGKPGFVSPMTTLVHTLMQANPALGIDAAETAIKAQVGVSGISLFGDYLQDALTRSATAKESQRVHNVARIVVASFSMNMEAVKTALGGSIDQSNLNAVIAIVNQKTRRQLSAIAAQVPTTIMSDTTVSQIAASLEIVDVTTIESQIAARVPAVVGSFQAAVQGDGFSGIDQTSESGQYCYLYEKVLLGASGNHGGCLLEQDISQYANGGWAPRVDSGMDYELADSGWVAVPGGPPAGAVQFNGDGTATFTRTATGRNQTISVSTLDVTGKQIAPYAGLSNVAVTPAVLFPAGSHAYEMTSTRVQDNYWLSGKSGLPAPAVDWLLSYYAAGSGKYLGVWDRTAVQFAGSGKTGTVKCFVDQQLKSQTGSWELKDVAGEPILLIKVPFAYKALSTDLTVGDDRIYGIAGGVVREGRVEYANIPRLEWFYNFNKIAMDTILRNFIP
jgi:hypothetical protein